MGSNPVFPKIYCTNWNAYVLNHVKINIANKNFQFNIVCNKQTIKIASVLKNFGIISHFQILKNKKNSKFNLIKVFIYYYKNNIFSKILKLLFYKNRSFYVTLPMLKLLNKRVGNSIYILTSKNGHITHHQALVNQVGGQLIFFIS